MPFIFARGLSHDFFEHFGKIEHVLEPDFRADGLYLIALGKQFLCLFHSVLQNVGEGSYAYFALKNRPEITRGIAYAFYNLVYVEITVIIFQNVFYKLTDKRIAVRLFPAWKKQRLKGGAYRLLWLFRR